MSRANSAPEQGNHCIHLIPSTTANDRNSVSFPPRCFFVSRQTCRSAPKCLTKRPPRQVGILLLSARQVEGSSLPPFLSETVSYVLVSHIPPFLSDPAVFVFSPIRALSRSKLLWEPIRARGCLGRYAAYLRPPASRSHKFSGLGSSSSDIRLMATIRWSGGPTCGRLTPAGGYDYDRRT
jgi:hypothetical protein